MLWVEGRAVLGLVCVLLVPRGRTGLHLVCAVSELVAGVLESVWVSGFSVLVCMVGRLVGVGWVTVPANLTSLKVFVLFRPFLIGVLCFILEP